MTSESLQAQNVAFGAYRLPASLIGQMSNSVPFEVTISDEKIAEINKAAKTLYNDQSSDYISISNNVIYLGRNSSTPEIGDMRITIISRRMISPRLSATPSRPIIPRRMTRTSTSSPKAPTARPK